MLPVQTQSNNKLMQSPERGSSITCLACFAHTTGLAVLSRHSHHGCHGAVQLARGSIILRMLESWRSTRLLCLAIFELQTPARDFRTTCLACFAHTTGLAVLSRHSHHGCHGAIQLARGSIILHIFRAWRPSCCLSRHNRISTCV